MFFGLILMVAGAVMIWAFLAAANKRRGRGRYFSSGSGTVTGAAGVHYYGHEINDSGGGGGDWGGAGGWGGGGDFGGGGDGGGGGGG